MAKIVKLTAHLDLEDLKRILMSYAHKEYKRDVIDIKFNVETQYEDRGGGSYQVFTGIDIQLDKIQSNVDPY